MGDAVMAVFGVPVAHEDDALRAARAALEMRTTLTDLNAELERRWGERLEVRTGVNSGEVVVGETPGGAPTTLGDAVNVAQRLEGAAPAGEVLIGEETARLISPNAELAPIDSLTLKGKSAPVEAWRLVSVSAGTSEAPDRAMAPLVGREAELRLLRESFDEVAATRTPRLVTVVGPAGIGKSRLVRALRADLRDVATTAVGRCLPYGEGVAYWPVAEIARRLAGEATETALATTVGDGTPGEEDGAGRGAGRAGRRLRARRRHRGGGPVGGPQAPRSGRAARAASGRRGGHPLGRADAPRAARARRDVRLRRPPAARLPRAARAARGALLMDRRRRRAQRRYPALAPRPDGGPGAARADRARRRPRRRGAAAVARGRRRKPAVPPADGGDADRDGRSLRRRPADDPSRARRTHRRIDAG